MARPSYDDLRACFLNCTLKPSPEVSHTDRLMDDAAGIMKAQGVEVTRIRVVDHPIAFGVQPDMRESGAKVDAWPEEIWPVIEASDIVVLGTPLWLGEESSVCRLVIERLYAHSGQTNAAGQYIFYGKVGGCVVTGNEDGVKHAAMTCLYALQHVGFTIAPQADCGWIGEAGPGPSFGDDGAGLDNDFTKRNTTFMTWNLLHFARMLKDRGGVPAHGNQTTLWNEGERFDHPRG